MRVQLKSGASTVKAKPRRYDLVKTSWLASCVAALLAFAFVFRNLQAVWSSPAMAVPKKGLVPLGERLHGGERTVGEVSGCHA